MKSIKEIYAVEHFIDKELYKLIIKNKEIEISMILKKDLLKKLIGNIKEETDPYWYAIEKGYGKHAILCKDCGLIERAKKRERTNIIKDLEKLKDREDLDDPCGYVKDLYQKWLEKGK